MTAVLFVCIANTCRSPAAEGILRHKAEKEGIPLHVESCGIGSWNVGELPNPRMREAALARGVNLNSRAQCFVPEFFDRFDWILVVDRQVLKELYRYALKPEHKSKLHLITHFSSAYKNMEIPDPYYGGDAGFEHVLDILEDACEGLIQHVKAHK